MVSKSVLGDAMLLRQVCYLENKIRNKLVIKKGLNYS